MSSITMTDSNIKDNITKKIINAQQEKVTLRMETWGQSDSPSRTTQKCLLERNKELKLKPWLEISNTKKKIYVLMVSKGSSSPPM